MISQIELEKVVLTLIAEHRGVEVSKLSPNTPINFGKGSLGVDGADADDLIVFLVEKLGWTIKDFDYDLYFGPEVGFEPFNFLYALLFRKPPKLAVLTIGELSRIFYESMPKPEGSRPIGDG